MSGPGSLLNLFLNYLSVCEKIFYFLLNVSMCAVPMGFLITARKDAQVRGNVAFLRSS